MKSEDIYIEKRTGDNEVEVHETGLVLVNDKIRPKPPTQKCQAVENNVIRDIKFIRENYDQQPMPTTNVFGRLGGKVTDKKNNLKKRKVVLIGEEEDPTYIERGDEDIEIMVASAENTKDFLQKKFPKVDSSAYEELIANKEPFNSTTYMQLSLSLMKQRDGSRDTQLRELLLLASSVHMEIVNHINKM